MFPASTMDRRMVETFDQPDPRIPLRELVLFMLVLALCTFGPWALHFAVAWWAVATFAGG
jgi:hypothetical protein